MNSRSPVGIAAPRAFPTLSAIIFFICALGWLTATPTFAQSSTPLSGTVTDRDRKPVAGASVTLLDRTGAVRQTAVTDETGTFRFENPPSGSVLVVAEARDFGKATRELRLTGAGQTVDLTLDVSAVADEIVITASGTPQTADEVSKALTVVTADEIERRNELSIPEALRNVPGFRVRQLGGPGSFTSFRTRGLRGFDTAVLIDGQRLRDSASTQGDAGAFLEQLFVVDTNRVEVLRGSGSSLYGTNAIGGVVNVASNQGGGATHGQIQLEGGGLGMFRGRANVAGGLVNDRFIYSAGLMHLNVTEGVNGNDPNRNWSGQGFAKFNVTPRTSVSGRVIGNTAFLQLTGSPFSPSGFALPPLSAGPIRAIPLGLEQQRLLERNQPFTLGNANYVANTRDLDNRRDSDYRSGLISFNHRFTDSLAVQANYQKVITNRQFTNGPGGPTLPFGQPVFGTRSNFDGRIDTFNVRADANLTRYVQLTAGYEFERERYLSRNRDFNPNPATRLNVGSEVPQDSHTFFFQTQFAFLERRLQLSLAGRAQNFRLDRPEFRGGASVYDGLTFTNPATAYTGDASAAYFIARTGTKIRAHVGNGYRAPSLFERFGSSFSGGTFSAFGDPRLASERTLAVDAGIDQSLFNERVKFTATYFYTRLQNVIVFDFTGLIRQPDPFGRFGGYANTRGGLARGAEFSGTVRATRTTTVTASYTYTNSDNRVPAQVAGFLPAFGISNHQFSATVLQNIGRRLDVAFDLFATSDYVFPFRGRAFSFAGPKKADIVVNYRLPVGERTLRLYGKVDNFTNNAFFEDGFRAPRAVFSGGVAFQF